jgi:hypothetical protein
MHSMLEPVLLRLKRATTTRHVMLLPAALLLTACATVQLPPPGETARPAAPPVETAEQQALRSLVSQQDRLYRVAAPLLVNNAPLCKSYARNLIGFTAKTKYSYSDEYANTAQQILGLDDRLQVMGVLAGSGAARAGVQRGDILTSVEGQPMPQGPDAERQASSVLAPLVTDRSNVKLAVVRSGSNLTLNVPLTRACGFGIELGNADQVNAYADGRRVLVTRGMMRVAGSDDELAYVLAKELAHNALGHADRLRMNATVGGIIDNLIRVNPDAGMLGGGGGVKAMPKEMDAAADTLALYMLARAGYNINNAPRFWQRLANEYPAAVLNGYTAIHPSTAYRLAAMEKTVAAIKAKQAGNRPLVP